VIETLTDLPEGVIGFRMSGKLEAPDYRDVLIPTIEVAAAGGRIRVVLVVEEFGGLSGGAVWEDLKLATEHLRVIERFAVATDLDWMVHLIHLFGWMVPGEIRIFPTSERTRAIAWAATGETEASG